LTVYYFIDSFTANYSGSSPVHPHIQAVAHHLPGSVQLRQLVPVPALIRLYRVSLTGKAPLQTR